MNAAGVLRIQFEGNRNQLAECLEGISDAEWRSRPYPGTNRVGFTAWHVARTADWGLNTCILGRPEVARGAEFADIAQAAPGIGAGIALPDADAVAERVSAARVAEYYEAVHAQLMEWIGTLEDGDLDTVPDSEAHQAANPDYQSHGFREETDDLYGMPVWRFATGPMNGHARRHIGELAAAIEAARRSPEAAAL